MAIEGAEIAVRLPRKVRSNPTLTVVGVVVFIAALKLAREFVVAVLIGILISYALRSMVDRLEALRVPRPVAAALILLALIGGSGWIVYSLSAEASVMIEKLPDSARKLRLGLNAMRNHGPTALRNVQEAANELQRAADAPAQSGGHLVAAPTTAATAWLRDYAVTQSTHLVGIAAQTPVVLLLAYFLLASGAHFRRKLVQWVGPSLTRKKDALRMLGEIDAQVQRYTVCNARVEYLNWPRNLACVEATWLGARRRLGLRGGCARFRSLFGDPGGGDCCWHCRIPAIRHDNIGACRGRHHNGYRGNDRSGVRYLAPQSINASERCGVVHRFTLLWLAVGNCRAALKRTLGCDW